MRIPRDFDRWMFDYKEGNLSQSEIDYFEHFIAENPQHYNDVEAWDNSYIQSQDIAYPQMESLIKEKSYGKWMGWAAMIIILFVSLSTLFLFQNKSDATYSLRLKGQNNLYKTNSDNKLLTTNSNHQFNHVVSQNQSNIATTVNHFNLISNSSLNNQANLNKTNEVYLSKNNSSNQLKNNLSNKMSEIDDQSNNQFKHSLKNNTSNHHNQLLDIEFNKINNGNKNNIASYKSNPNYTSNLKLTKKSKSNHKFMAYKLKKLYRKIERMAGYPIGLINLHDPEILTPNNNLLSSNCGFTGSLGSPRLEIRQRMQWLGQENTLEQSFVNFDTYNKNLKSGIGVMLNRNSFNHGQYEDYNVNFLYSPKIQVGRKIFFEPAVKLTMGVLRINTQKVNYNSTYEVDRAKIIFTGTPDGTNHSANNLWYKDLGVGFVLNAPKFYIGANADNLARHNEFIYGKNKRSNIKINAIIGSDYQSKNKKMVLSPFMTYTQSGHLKEIWGGVNTKIYWLTVGGAYSSLGDYSASIGLKFRNFKLIYQYDRTTSFINNDRFASHNIGIRINAKQKTQR